MSINEVIKKYLPVANKKLSQVNKQYHYCFAYSYQNCDSCKEVKRIKCYQKLVYQSVRQVATYRWHLYFLCSANHLVIRWVDTEGASVLIGRIKN